MNRTLRIFQRFAIVKAAIIAACLLATHSRACAQYADMSARVALRTNMLHDALLTPDIGVELTLYRKFSIGIEGVGAWWSNDSKHRFWRIKGGWVDMQLWLGSRCENRALTGHHIGVYGSMHTFDFEFGGKGWQSPDWTFGCGISYGYSIRIAPRLNIDFSARVGYSTGTLVEYRPQCGAYVCTNRSTRHYLGLTGIGVTLVWFPGRGDNNNPDYGM